MLGPKGIRAVAEPRFKEVKQGKTLSLKQIPNISGIIKGKMIDHSLIADSVAIMKS